MARGDELDLSVGMTEERIDRLVLCAPLRTLASALHAKLKYVIKP